MEIHDGNTQNRRVFFGTSPVREVYEGSRKIIGFNNITPVTSDFVGENGAEIKQGNGLIVISIPELGKIGASGKTLEFCDDMTICPFDGGITMKDMTGGDENLTVAYLGESSGLTQKYYLKITYKGNEIYKQEKKVYTTTRIRVWYDLSAKRLKVHFDSELLFESPIIQWRLWQVNFVLSFFYSPPQVIAGNPPTMIDAIFIGGWVQIFSMNKSVGYPRP